MFLENLIAKFGPALLDLILAAAMGAPMSVFFPAEKQKPVNVTDYSVSCY
jgi:hypothetical protein